MELVWVKLRQSAALDSGWNMEDLHCQGPVPHLDQFRSLTQACLLLPQRVPTCFLPVLWAATHRPKWKPLNIRARRRSHEQSTTSKPGEGWKPLDKCCAHPITGRERLKGDTLLPGGMPKVHILPLTCRERTFLWRKEAWYYLWKRNIFPPSNPDFTC